MKKILWVLAIIGLMGCNSTTPVFFKGTVVSDYVQPNVDVLESCARVKGWDWSEFDELATPERPQCVCLLSLETTLEIFPFGGKFFVAMKDEVCEPEKQ